MAQDVRGAAAPLPWHATEIEETRSALGTDHASGLTTAQVADRLDRFGPNVVPQGGGRSAFQRLIGQFSNPLIVVLLVAGVVTLFMDHPIDAAVIFAVVLINAGVGFIQEGRAEQALAAVRRMMPERAVVIREAERCDILAADLVPGDLVLVEAGDRVPADLRLIRTRSMRTDEAALTGESVPVGKRTLVLPETTALADRTCMAYSGTTVVSGAGRGLVIATGAETELGHISSLVEQTGATSTPLTRRLDVFARQITVFILAVGAALLAITVMLERLPLDEAFLAVVGLAVAAIPEGLPAVITIILAIAARTMAHNRAIVRRLPAVETLGSVSTICSDKTGTLTRNEMTAVALYGPDESIHVTGTGYDPEGGFRDQGGSHLLLADHPWAVELTTAAALCNDASLRFAQDAGEWVISGDPTEGSLATLAHKADIDLAALRAACPRIDEIPFASENRFMATLHHDHQGHAWVIVKGAPERVAKMAVGPDRTWHAAALQAAAEGQRVLAVATAAVTSGTTSLSAEELPPDLRMVGMIGIQDPARGEAVTAIEDCHRAGIAVKMITGDHLATAEAVGSALGLHIGRGGLEGHDIDAMTDTQARAALQDTDIIARASPDNKLRLVRLLQEDGQFVAMTGDGANDAPALKAADIGVAMGGRGTDAAREASDLVLVDDNFRTIRDAVHEGRVVYDNIKKSLAFILPTNGGEGLLILVALLAGWALPVTVTQILWVNMVTAVTLALALAFEAPEPDVMTMPPRPARQPLLTGPLLTQIAWVSGLLVIITTVAFEWELSRGSSVETARTAAVTTLVVAEVFYLYSVRHFTRSAFTLETLLGSRPALIVTAILAVLQGSLIYAPFMQAVFGTRALDTQSWVIVLALCTAMFAGVEASKWLWRRVGVSRL